MFREIDDHTFGQAGEVIAAVHSGQSKGTAGLPNLNRMVAGAVVALEKGAPNAVYDAHDSVAESYVSPGSREWRMLHKAVARVIDVDARDPSAFVEPQDVMRHIVSDVSHQARHARVATALDLPDLAPKVPSDLREAFDQASVDPMKRADISVRRMGSYEALPVADQTAMQEELRSGSALPRTLSMEVRRVSSAMEKASDEGMYWDSVRAQPGFGEKDVDVFRPIPAEAVSKVGALLAQGVSTGDRALDAGIKAHAALDPKPTEHMAMSNVMGVDTNDVSGLLARARMIDDVERGAFVGGASEIARRIESDRILMDAGQRDVSTHDRPSDRMMAFGAYHSLPPAEQNAVHSTLQLESNVPAITSVRMDIEVHEPKRDTGSMMAQRQAAMAMQGMQR